jgi:Pyruvate/2-oxoacid:ferredoxin oxidoreductase delta subunit
MTMVKVNDPYQVIAEMWTFPESQSFRKMLEAIITRPEAELLLELRTPITVPELAKKLNVDETTLAAKLDNFTKRGLIFRGKTQYQFKRGLHFNFAGMPASEEYEPPDEYRKWRKIWEDENPKREVNDWLAWYKKTGNPIHRVYPSRLAIQANPRIKKEQLLWHEDIEQIFRRAEIIVAGPCGCRSGGSGMMGGKKPESSVRCNHPIWNCFQFSKSVLEFNLGRGNEMRVYSVEQALAKSDEAERAGLIHEGPGNAAIMPGIICSCASDCCSMLYQCQACGEDIRSLYTPSRFQPLVDQEKCSGCQSCVERCSFSAIQMVKVPGSKKMKAELVNDQCMGCGVCVVGCPQKALTYELVRPPEHIPPADASPLKPPVPLK